MVSNILAQYPQRMSTLCVIHGPDVAMTQPINSMLKKEEEKYSDPVVYPSIHVFFPSHHAEFNINHRCGCCP